MKNFKLCLVVLIEASFLFKCRAFNPLFPKSFHRFPITHKSHISRTGVSSLAGKNADNDEKLSARTDINHFLTQRTIQCFMLLLKQMRDPHTGTWIENFLGSKNLLEYHGTGAIDLNMFPNWDSALLELIEQPPDVVILEIEASNTNRGLSKNNPYREEENRVIEIEIDIDPPSLAGRLLSVREKIAAEFVKDLDLLIVANKEILNSYNKKCLDARKDEECAKSSKEKEEGDDDKRDIKKPVEAETKPKGFDFGQRTVQTFDREAVYMINNHPSFNDPGSSLLRSTSFDLLFLLSTQESIHRVLKSYKEEGEGKEVSFAWLLDFYTKGLEKYFDGNQSFGRADDFLDDLFLTPPSLKTIDEHIGFIDPLMIAEDIINVREEVAEEWRDLISLAPQDHESIRQAVFVKQMAKWGHTVEEIDSSDTKDTEDEIKEEVVEVVVMAGKYEEVVISSGAKEEVDDFDFYGEFE